MPGVGQQLGEAGACRVPGRRDRAHERVERWRREPAGPGQQPSLGQASQVEHLVPDGDPDAWRLPRPGEHPVGQVLDREIAAPWYLDPRRPARGHSALASFSPGGVGVLRSRGKSGSGAGASTGGDCSAWPPAAAPLSASGSFRSCPDVLPSCPGFLLSCPDALLSCPDALLSGSDVAPALPGPGAAPVLPGPAILSSRPDVAPSPWASGLARPAG